MWVSFFFGDVPFRRSFLHHGRGEALDGGAELGVADDEVDGGRFLLGHHDPLPLVHGDLQIPERAAAGQLHGAVGMGRGKFLRLAEVRPILLVGVGDVPLVKQPGQGQRGGVLVEHLAGQAGQLQVQLVLLEERLHLLPAAAGEGQHARPLLLGHGVLLEEAIQKFRLRRIQRRGGEQAAPPSGGAAVCQQEGVETRRLVLAVNVHQRTCDFQQGVRPAAVIRHLGAVVGEIVPALGVVPRHRLAGQCRRAADTEEVEEHAALGRFEVVRLDLTGHVHGDEALQPQHHLRQGAVDIVDDLQLQSLFQQHRHAEHPLFRKFRVLRHLGHGHIAVHKHRLHGAGQHRRLHKVQLAVHHLAQPRVRASGGQLEGHRGHLQLVKVDGAYVLVQIELVQLRQEAGNGVLPGRVAAQQPLLHAAAVRRPVGQLPRRTAQQLRRHLPLLLRVHLPRQVGRHRRGELLRLRRLPRTAAEAENGGRVIIGVAAQLRHADIHHVYEGVEVLPQHPFVRPGELVTLEERFLHRVLVHVRHALFPRQRGQRGAEGGERGAAPGGRALAGAVAAQRGGGQPRIVRQLLAPAAQPGDIFVQLLAKAHTAPPTFYIIISIPPPPIKGKSSVKIAKTGNGRKR